MKDYIVGALMILGAIVGMILLIAGISLAVMSPLILIVWLISKVLV